MRGTFQNEVPAPRAFLFQVVLPDTVGKGDGKEPTSATERPEKEPGQGEASEEGPSELRTQEQRQPADPG